MFSAKETHIMQKIQKDQAISDENKRDMIVMLQHKFLQEKQTGMVVELQSDVKFIREKLGQILHMEISPVDRTQKPIRSRCMFQQHHQDEDEENPNICVVDE